jgi:hypothetical protein
MLFKGDYPFPLGSPFFASMITNYAQSLDLVEATLVLALLGYAILDC